MKTRLENFASLTLLTCKNSIQTKNLPIHSQNIETQKTDDAHIEVMVKMKSKTKVAKTIVSHFNVKNALEINPSV
jgi:hypothetical protein